jgi:uncharacterized protein (TIRG00374 family)
MNESLAGMSALPKRLLNWQNALSLIFTILVISYVLFKLNWHDVYQTFNHIDYRWLAMSFIFYLINYFFRTIRFRHLLNLQLIPFYKLLGVTSLYGMYLYLMPAKAGEASYPLLLKNRMGVSLTQGTATLIVARFFDFATIALLLPFVLVIFWQKIDAWIRIGSILLVAITLSTGFLGLWFIRSPRWKGIIGTNKLSGSPLVNRLMRVLENLLIRLKEIDAQRRYFTIWLTTIVIWICVLANFYCVVLSLGYSLTIFEIIIISMIMIPMTLLPLQGFANLGTHEIGWTAAFAMFGYSRSSALAIAVSTHIILLALILLIGALGWAFSR